MRHHRSRRRSRTRGGTGSGADVARREGWLHALLPAASGDTEMRPIDRLGSVVVVVCCRTRRRVQVEVEANQDSILGSVALSRVGCEDTET